MGVRPNGAARVWKFIDKGNYGQIQLSATKYDKRKEKRVTDLSAFSNVVGTAYEVCKKFPAEIPKGGIPIRVSDFEVTSWYNEEKDINNLYLSIFALHQVRWDEESGKYVDIDADEVDVPEESEDLPF